MANHSRANSPLTGVECDQWHDILRCVYMFEEPLGSWGATDYVLDYGFKQAAKYHSPDLSLTEKETERLLAYARSVVWEAARLGKKRPFFMSAIGIREAREEDIAPLRENWHLLTPEDLWRDVPNITFEEKALRTLANLVLVEGDIGNGVWLPMGLRPYPGGFAAHRDPQGTAPEGLLYAAAGKEGLYLLHHLIEQQLIVEGEDHSAQDLSVYITPKGYAVADQVRLGERREVRRAFLVCRFTDVMDDMFVTCYKPTGEHPDVGCPIQRVKDVHHVDRIDDKIVHMIEEATIVVVDLTEQNFNVAFEAGYALALGKPIVWTMREDAGDFRPPFDIQSHNILRWHPDRLDEFREALRYRMIAALDKAAAVGVAKWPR